MAGSFFFFPKVISSFHLNHYIVLPSSARERSLHALNVVWAIRVFLRMMAQIRKTDSLFVLLGGPRKEQAASKTISH